MAASFSACADCGDTDATVYVVMVPPAPLAPFRLCSTCYRKGGHELPDPPTVQHVTAPDPVPAPTKKRAPRRKQGAHD